MSDEQKTKEYEQKTEKINNKKNNETITVNNSQADLEMTNQTQWTKIGAFNKKTGHGFAAEDAEEFTQKSKLKSVTKDGTSNAKNGADLTVNGIEIQSKYCSTASRSVNSAFDKKTGVYRYLKDGKPMVLEVPKDQKDSAVDEMKQKILEGKVPGVTDPEKAKELIKGGSVTYDQAKKISQAGNFESIKYDAAHHVVTTLEGFSLSFILVYIQNKKNGQDNKEAASNAAKKAGISASENFTSSVLTQQVLKTDANKKLSKSFFNNLWKSKKSRKILKTICGTKNKTGCFKILDSNGIDIIISGIITNSLDIYKASISKSISWTQVGKNFSVWAGGVTGAKAGALGGGKIGEAIGTIVQPGSGTAAGKAAGTVIGSIGGGFAGAAGAKKLTNAIAKDDAELMTEIMNERVAELASEYGLTEEEFENKVLPKIKDKVDGKWLVRMFKFGDSKRDNIDKQRIFVDKELVQLFDDCVEKSNKSIFSKLVIKIKTRKIHHNADVSSSISIKPLIYTGIIALILLLLAVLIPSLKKLNFNKGEKSSKQINVQTQITSENDRAVEKEIEKIPEVKTAELEQISQTEVSEVISIPETKSFEFRADRRDYVDNHDAKLWCDDMALEIKDKLSKNPDLKFIIKGYVADFDNEIDDTKLSLERAENIKKELVKRGISSEILITEAYGRTDRWGNVRKTNRAVTIESY